MFEDLAATGGMRFLLAATAVAAGLIILVAVLWILKNRPSSPFVRGGKNRQPRLAVLDAAAVDTRRRLVLVRRDEVEHLIMIGGPTDIVIESRIVGAQPATATTALPETRRPAEAAPALPAQAESAAPRVLERRAEPRPAPPPAPPAAPSQAPTGAPPISAMGQALYGEPGGSAILPQAARPQAAAAPRAPERPAQPRPEAARPELARAEPARPEPPRPDPRRAATAPAGRSPEDILDAARNRVLNTPPSEPRPAPAPNPAVIPAPPAAEAQRRSDAGDFERLLDAEISGDLSRLTATPAASPAPGRPAAPSAPRNEPTLEEEMNRMLGEMGQRRS